MTLAWPAGEGDSRSGTLDNRHRRHRRTLVLGGAAFAMQAGCGAVAESLAGEHGQHVHLADFGGVPSASRASIIAAFDQAFRYLKEQGGGVLEVGAGSYNLGPYSGGTAIAVSDLRNVLISGYGAQLTMRTVATSKLTGRGRTAFSYRRRVPVPDSRLWIVSRTT
jgi:hypothetical protein